MLHPPFKNKKVKAVFDGYPSLIREDLLKLRGLIFHTGLNDDRIGGVEETLKWGQPSYLPHSGSGTTIRIDALKDSETQYGLYVHCQTTLIATFKELYPRQFVYEDKRAIIFNTAQKPDQAALQHCISLALLYHWLKKQGM